MHKLRHILIIDDEQAIAEALGVRLAAAGHTIVQSLGGYSGIAEAKAQPPDVILLDVYMMDLDGYEVCKRLKSNPLTTGIPVLFMSADTTEVVRQKARAVGGVGFIAKPYVAKEILDAIESAVEMQRRAAG